MHNFSWKRVTVAVILLVMLSFVLTGFLRRVGNDTLDWDAFIAMAEEDRIAGVQMQSRLMRVRLHDDPKRQSWRVFYPAGDGGSVAAQVTELMRESQQRSGRRVGVQGQAQTIGMGVWVSLGILAILGLMLWRLWRSQTFFGSRSVGIRADPDTLPGLDAVAGIRHARDEIADILTYLSSPDRYVAIGARMPRGLILEGPPGTGKTLLAKALAHEAGVPFFAMSGSDFVEMFVGVGASRVRSLFRQARECERAIIFIDEIDAIARRRSLSVSSGSNSEQEHALNAILVEMDGFNDRTHVLVVAATNRSDILDPALVRPGRFDRRISIDLPSREDRAAILRLHAQTRPVDPDVDWDMWAGLTAGMSGADLANLLNEAAVAALRADTPTITEDAIRRAWDRMVTGISSRRPLSPEMKQRIAVHEMGHAVAMACHAMSRPLLRRVSVLGGGPALGATIRMGTDDPLLDEPGVLAEVRILLAGIAAEEWVFGTIANGGSDDLRRAAGLIRRALTQWGMGGSAWLMPAADRPEEQRDMLSQATLERIDQLVSGILGALRTEIFQAITACWTDVEPLVECLVVNDDVDGDAVRTAVAEQRFEHTAFTDVMAPLLRSLE